MRRERHAVLIILQDAGVLFFRQFRGQGDFLFRCIVTNHDNAFIIFRSFVKKAILLPVRKVGEIDTADNLALLAVCK